MKNRIILAITGASGSIYALEFAKLLASTPYELHGIISEAGEKVLRIELGINYEALPNITKWYGINEFTAPMASGSSRFTAMVILPCTMGTLGAIANGISGNLVHRSADVMLKERLPLLVTPRETPLNRIHLKNMLALHDAGAIVCPPMPAFYHRPANLEEMGRQFASRVADLLGIDPPGVKRWGTETIEGTPGGHN